MAQHLHEHENFPYLTEEDYKTTLKNSPEDLDAVNRLGEAKFHKRIQRYSLKENLSVDPSNDMYDLRLVLLGKTGVGKSALGNTILGFQAFKNEPLARSVTAKSICMRAKINNRIVKVMDTPGLHDTNQDKNIILEEIARVTKIFPEGVHAFIYVRNISDTRFTKEENDTLDQIEKKFGGKVKPFRILAYTYAESQLHDKDLKTYCDFQKQDETQTITQFLGELKNNIVAVDNKTTVPAEKVRNQKAVLALVDKVTQANGGNVYTSEMFTKAIEEHRKLKIEAERKGWSPELLEIVDMFIAADPDIVDREGELGKKVHQYQLQKLEKDLRQKFHEQLKIKMQDLNIERQHLKELEEKQRKAEEALHLKIEEEKKMRLSEQETMRKKLETEKQRQEKSNAQWRTKFKEQQKYQEQRQREALRWHEEEQRKLYQQHEEERKRFEEEKRRHHEMLTRYEKERSEQQQHLKEVQKSFEEERQRQQKQQRELERRSEEEQRRQQERQLEIQRNLEEEQRRQQKEREELERTFKEEQRKQRQRDKKIQITLEIEQRKQRERQEKFEKELKEAKQIEEAKRAAVEKEKRELETKAKLAEKKAREIDKLQRQIKDMKSERYLEQTQKQADDIAKRHKGILSRVGGFLRRKWKSFWG